MKKKTDKAIAENPIDKIFDIVDNQIEDVVGSDIVDNGDNVIKQGKAKRVQCGNLWYGIAVENKKLYFRVYSTKTTRKHIWQIPADNDGKGYIQMLVYLSKFAGVN